MQFLMKFYVCKVRYRIGGNQKTAVLSLLFLECNFLEISVICLESFAKIYDWPNCLF